MLYVAGIVEESYVDGPGMRLAVFMQGCGHKCPECHNQHTHAFVSDTGERVGTPYTKRDLYCALTEIMERNPLINGVTFTGGDPVYQREELLSLVMMLKADERHLILYTGFTPEKLFDQVDLFEDITSEIGGILNPYSHYGTIAHFLGQFDLVITDPFIIAHRDLAFPFRGSTNQRIWKTRFDGPGFVENLGIYLCNFAMKEISADEIS